MERSNVYINNHDQIENLCGSILQHGSFNDRIYLMDIGNADPEKLVSKLIILAQEKGYSKIFAKIPSSKSSPFIAMGFQQEARIPFFYRGSQEAQFLGYYLNNSRKQELHCKELDNILKIAKLRKENPGFEPLPDKYLVRRCIPDDIEAMAKIYRTVFPTYPFPIHDPEYLRDTMNTHVEYFGIETSGQLVALSSTEMDQHSKNAEMTDFATLPEWRGHGFACHLLKKMEQVMKSKNLQLAYTIARAMSPGMNIAFAKRGYIFGGRLINNTNISGQIESMNVWYKKI